MSKLSSTVDARRAILSRITQSLSQSTLRAATPGDNDATRRAAVKERLAKHSVNSTLARVDKSHSDLVALFCSYLEGQSASVIEVATPDDIPTAIAQYLRDNNFPPRLRMGDDAYLKAVDWSSEPNLTRDFGSAKDKDVIGLSHALAGAAETGTLYLASGKANPVTVNFLPDAHIVVLRKKDIVGCYEMAWDKLRDAYGTPKMPRTLNMISGPSRTADIAGILVQGAHGPKDMCVIIVDDE